MKRIASWTLLVCLVVGMLAGCGGGDGGQPAGETRVVFVPKLTGNAFFEAANNGAQAFAAQQGFVVDYQGSPQASIEDQIAIVEQAIEDKADAICISALDATALDAVMKRAMDAGIKVVTWDSDVSGDARMLMVSQGTPEQLGTMLVEMGAKSLAARGKNPGEDKIRYVWHYSQEIVADQNSWNRAGEAYIQATYPNWVNVAPQNYYSQQDPALALSVGTEILEQHTDIDLIICNDSTSLPGQAQAAKELGLTAEDVTITGFASPNAMRTYCKEGIVERWGLWDCQVQGALGCYLAYYLAQGNMLKVGDKVDVPDIGIVTVMPNTVLDAGAYTAENSGVILLPSRSEYTISNVDDYDF
ncbi:substrate-binding domain-containing protein [Ruminococcaceae bacterium OttesenSCG-928-O06]|nr:substrate-binding domain-containing protein [Ruminococcaceae bacterium OttesenSCG-928-O06]